VLVAVLAVFFQRTRIGRALRAVADDHEAALSIGIPLKTIWVVVWSVAGLVAIATGIMWGEERRAVQPVADRAQGAAGAHLGGFTVGAGSHRGGLIIGVGEKLGEVYWGPLVGGAIENWFAYVLALVLPPLPPAGPVRRADHRARLRDLPRGRAVQERLRRDQAIFPIARIAGSCAGLRGAAFVVPPRSPASTGCRRS
jgi:branched-subunit amino acid ABC-type transport system permease component